MIYRSRALKSRSMLTLLNPGFGAFIWALDQASSGAASSLRRIKNLMDVEQIFNIVKFWPTVMHLKKFLKALNTYYIIETKKDNIFE